VISRRQFLATLGSAILLPAAALELGEELLLPAKKFFLPPKQGWVVTPSSGNTLLTVSYISNEAIRILANHIRISNRMTDHVGEGRTFGHIAINNRTWEKYGGKES